MSPAIPFNPFSAVAIPLPDRPATKVDSHHFRLVPDHSNDYYKIQKWGMTNIYY